MKFLNQVHFGLMVAFCSSGMLLNVAQATTYRVPFDFPTIQGAINAASENDTILVAAGTYLETIRVDGKNLRLQSESGAAATILDASNTNVAVSLISVGRQTILDGFTVQGGLSFSAGGILVNNGAPTIINNIIQNNRGVSGNGVGVQFSAPLIRNNVIRNNTNAAGISGGGGGGGIYVGGSGCQANVCTEIRGNLIEANSTPAFIWGGGILLFASGPVRIIGNTIRNNVTSLSGGGIAAFNNADAQIENNIIVGNRTTSLDGQGGGIYWQVPSDNRGPWLIGNTIVNNQAQIGAAIYADGYDGAARIGNNIILNTAVTTAVVYCGNSNDPFPPVIRNNMIQGGGSAEFSGLCASALGSEENFSAAPVFQPGGYRFSPGSAGIDRGLNAYVSEPFDIDGKIRVVDGNAAGGRVSVDVGASEYQELLFAGGFE